MLEVYHLRVVSSAPRQGGLRVELAGEGIIYTAGLPGFPQIKRGDKFDLCRTPDRRFHLYRAGVEVATIFHHFPD